MITLAHSLVRLHRSSLVGLLLFGTILGIQLPSNPEPVRPDPSPTQAANQSEQPALGIVKSAENAAQWQSITERLNASGLAYQVIDWETVDRTTSFDAVQVLFLPNLETISPDQLLSLQTFLNRGGRLIVSGAVGRQSSTGVQSALRSLLGAYWSGELSQPQALQPLRIVSEPWVREAETDSPVTGGLVVPTSLASQPVVAWSRDASSQGGAAVVVTYRSTFLGWRWGDPAVSAANLDSSWLKAAVERFQDSAATGAPSTTHTPTVHTPTVRTPTITTRPDPSASSPVMTTVPATPIPSATQPPTQPPTQPLTPTPVSSPPARNLTQLLNRPSSPAPAPSTGVSTDPAEQVADAELNVERNTRITLYQATTLRQELENLIGRYESALILTQTRLVANGSLGHSTATVADRPSRTLTETGAAPVALKTEHPSEATQSASVLDDPVLMQARQGYQTFSQALSQQDYATARQSWLATRQLLWENFPLDRPLAQPEVRAIWLDRGTIVSAGSRQGLARIFDRLQAAGINTVFFETVNAGYPIYPSRVAPAQNPLTRNWDPLAEAVDLAHARGMELHAWVWTFAAGNQAHNAILNQPWSYPGPVLSAHPDWAGYDNRGSMIPPGQKKPFLDPANPEVRQYLLSLFEEIVSRYDVDGLQLDYIRYPFQDPHPGGHTYGYGTAARQQFQQLTGVDPATLTPSELRPGQTLTPAQQLWQQWTAFRLEQINSFVADTASLVHRLNPDLVLSTAVFALPEQQRINEIQQNWELWAQRGDVDMIVLMSYASDTSGLQRLTQRWLSGSVDLGAALILPGIRMLNLSDQTVMDQIQTLRDSSSGGFALFAAENLDAQLQAIFQQTQGAAISANEPIPYRQPFATAAERYDVLLQQWNWLIDQGQLQLSSTQLAEWQTQTNAVQQALQTLRTNPSSQNLYQAQTALSRFESRFHGWVNLPTLSEEYRVQTWKNQLAIIARLLDYGEQTLMH